MCNKTIILNEIAGMIMCTTFENQNDNFFFCKRLLASFEGIFTNNFLSALLTLSIPDGKTKSRSNF